MRLEDAAGAEIVKRLRRVEGQVGGIIRMIEEGRDCADVVTQLAAASKALDRAGFRLVASGMRQCLDEDKRLAGRMTVDEMERLFLALA